MGGEMGRMRPTKVFERAGESRMTPPSPTLSRRFTRLGRFLAPYEMTNDALSKGFVSFYAGEQEYQADVKWYTLIEEADRQLLAGGAGGGPIGPHGPDIDDFTNPTPTSDVVSTISGAESVLPPLPIRTLIPSNYT